MKKEINVFDYASDIMNALQSGVLLTAKAGGKINSMAISWGTLGIEWGHPIFTVFVREHRFTKQMLEENPEFTINIPYGSSDKQLNKQILGFCGTRSGRDVDKARALNLTLEPSCQISVPGIREFPLTLECKVVYKQEQDKHAIPEETRKRCYPEDVDSSFHGANRDYHTAFYGEIVSAYIIQ